MSKDNDLQLTRNNSFDIEKEGEKILETHDFYRDLSEIMEDKKFVNFFNKYFTSMTETKITLVYMKLYNEFKNKWNELTDTELDKKINVFLLWKMMKDRNMNKFALHTVINHLEHPKKVDIFDELKQFIEISEKYMKLKD